MKKSKETEESILIKEFILNRLKDRYTNLTHVNTKIDKKLHFVVIDLESFDDNNKYIHRLKFLATDIENINKWYSITHFDSDYTKKDKEQTLIDYPLQKSLEEHYPQIFIVNGIEYRVKYNTSTLKK